MPANYLNTKAERARAERENSEFTEWWNRAQACPEHNLVTENAAHAAWQERARRTPTAADGAALDLPPLPDGDEYSATRMLANGELAPRFTAATMRQYARDAIAHYLSKQAGQVESVYQVRFDDGAWHDTAFEHLAKWEARLFKTRTLYAAPLSSAQPAPTEKDGIAQGYECLLCAQNHGHCWRHKKGEQSSPADPMDWPIPCDITVGAVTIRKNCMLRTLVARMESLHRMATAALPTVTQEQKDANWKTLLAASRETLNMHHEVTGGLDYGYISPKPQAAVDAFDRPAQSAVQAEPPKVEIEQDPLYEKSVKIVRSHNRASLSLVQRTLLIGYNRTARLFEAMEKAGVVSALDANGHRTVAQEGEQPNNKGENE